MSLLSGMLNTGYKGSEGVGSASNDLIDKSEEALLKSHPGGNNW